MAKAEIEEEALGIILRSDPEDVSKLQELKSLVASRLETTSDPDITGDLRLLRFLHEYILPEIAAEKFRAFLNWRKENNVDEIRKLVQCEWEDLPGHLEVTKHLPSVLLLRSSNGSVLADKQKNPVAVEFPGLVKIRDFVNNLPLKTLIQAHIANLEKRSLYLDDLSRSSGRLVKMTLIKDFDSADVKSIFSNPRKAAEVLRRVKTLTGIAGSFYPQTVRKTFLLNVPSVFAGIWKALKPFLSQNQLESTVVSSAGGLVAEFDYEVIQRIQEIGRGFNEEDAISEKENSEVLHHT